ncbi:hypothetical protein VRU48_00210 [Pedobacter sp. KR3-3]|uniref:DUF3592 domain-containing protein n=1 Tax=Pedobacter albus TaxID=3113905 RepID=A0ABU7I287_9SPHI|nr:hypothetical protein [Pedobacter sp. KR3-3]MEE1943507.1 hypothetical protein [Pedobacter sp. KR3-3]
MAFYDWKSIWRIVFLMFFLVLALAFFFNFGYLKMQWLGRGLKEEANGLVISRQINHGMNQTLTGTNQTINSVKFVYQYQFNHFTKIDSCELTYSLWNAKALQKLAHSTLPVRVVIKHNHDASKSLLWLP